MPKEQLSVQDVAFVMRCSRPLSVLHIS